VATKLFLLFICWAKVLRKDSTVVSLCLVSSSHQSIINELLGLCNVVLCIGLYNNNNIFHLDRGKGIDRCIK